jgi:hypothetical protein
MEYFKMTMLKKLGGNLIGDIKYLKKMKIKNYTGYTVEVKITKMKTLEFDFDEVETNRSLEDYVLEEIRRNYTITHPEKEVEIIKIETF